MQGARERLVSEFGTDRAFVGASEMAPFLSTWFGDETGSALAVLRPRDVADVQAMVRACVRLGLGIVPQGGNTGLVSGGLTLDPAAHVCLNLGRLNRIRAIDADDYSATVEAGCILQSVKDAAAEQGLFVPVTIGSQGSCQIGGLISTNAGGLNVLRYGMMREQVLGLEAVLADGTLWEGLSTLRKNNMGPDLKQVFIGAEGTFGIVTAASLRLVPVPDVSASALIAMPDLAATMKSYHLARRVCSDLLSAFEFFMPPAMKFARDATPDAPGLALDGGVYALVELAAPGPVDLAGLLEGFLKNASEKGLVSDGVIASSVAQAGRLWALREAVNEGQARSGPFLRSDVSVRLSDLPRFIEETCAAIEAEVPGAMAVAYGHFGDGNVHLNVLPPPEIDGDQVDALLGRAKNVLNDRVDAFRGSISAEHGIGRLKRSDFQDRLSGTDRMLLEGLKSTFDPAGRMNPGCIF